MPSESPAPLFTNDPCLPQPRTIEYEWMSVATWQAMHAAHVARAAEGDVELLLLGDSITQGWAGSRSGTELFAPYRTANFGIGGDATQNVLWRLADYPAGRLKPRLVVLLIGVNNLGREEHSPEQTLAGVRSILERVQSLFPGARVLLHAILPADASPGSPFRGRIEKTNTLFAALAADRGLAYLDATQALLEADGSLGSQVAPDGLHPNEEGYSRWASLLGPELRRLLR